MKYAVKNTKCTPSREVLDQYVFDFGPEAAQVYFNLTEAKYNSIMYDKITTKLPERFQYVEPTPDAPEVPELSPDFNELKNYICKNFKRLLEKHRALDSKKIDVRSMSAYDRAMEVLTDLLYYNSDYKYVNDSKTAEYIDNRMKNGMSVERVKAVKAEKLLEYTDEMDTESYQDHSAEDAANVMGRLSKTQCKVVQLVSEGYNQEEVADKLDISQQAVSRTFLRVQNKLSA